MGAGRVPGPQSFRDHKSTTSDVGGGVGGVPSRTSRKERHDHAHPGKAKAPPGPTGMGLQHHTHPAGHTDRSVITGGKYGRISMTSMAKDVAFPPTLRVGSRGPWVKTLQ